ncbi:MAG: PSD1 and planctomycete cytochrome C domain-containing protein [Candidatus Poribacteria bacterium]|nr:PSD1 and planctomycete cytochrome C domain-containing protein [Candidatus Poribacteria bacterium]
MIAFVWTILGCMALMLSFAPAAKVDAPLDFNRDIRPILSNHCFPCHGPDAKARQAKLRLDVRQQAIEKGAVVPGQPRASELLSRVEHSDQVKRMPPATTGKTLTPEQKNKLQHWIAEGANYDTHWAWVPPVRPAIPAGKNAAWPRNQIDYFILSQLEQVGLTPSPEASHSTLIRRLSLDLTGLPPSPEEVEDFINSSSEHAYNDLVERLLASTRFGERMAQHWLDLARYADSDGYHDDTNRSMWPYRDYVISSFNQNKPFDTFTREQIAGDQMPDATREQKVGSAFHRNGPTSSEGGANPDEYRIKYAVDRVNTTAAVWLGVTLQCAECHDHKFDPFSQREFYQFMAFFDQVPGNHLFRGLYAPPSITLPSMDQSNQLTKLEAVVTRLKKKNENEEEENNTQLMAAKKARDEFRDTIPQLRVMQDSEMRQPTHVLVRGDFRQPAERVHPGVPAVFPPLPEVTSPRLALAEWLVSADNPLPARVVVNRFWAMLFGRGIVKTAEDFGSQGEPPSHPKLLDWLALEFITSGWDVKHLLKYIVTSSTYRQSSAANAEQWRADPENRLLARGARFRLPAEMIRDNALYISGLLKEKIGGPSVKPYQPSGLWKEMSYGNSSGKGYQKDHGDNLYRRGIYTFWKRSILYPAFAIFDAPNREECTVRRPRTNTPLQAFVTLNSTAFVEAARVFAERILREKLGPEDRIDLAMEIALARSPSAVEKETLQELLADMKAHYQTDPDEACRIIAVGEWPVATDFSPVTLAAWTSVAQAILNLDETQTKE